MSKLVLIVEDDPQVRGLLLALLTQNGFSVVEAKDGTAALRQLWKHSDAIGALLTDVDMGRMDGVELAESVRAEHPDMPVLFISALPISLVDLERAAPGSKFLQKPFDSARLIEALRSLMGE